MYLIWDFGVQIDSIEQPIKSNSVSPGDMSHCRASSFTDHLDHCLVVFKHTASKEMISDSVELCESEVCFLHIQLNETNV